MAATPPTPTRAAKHSRLNRRSRHQGWGNNFDTPDPSDDEDGEVNDGSLEDLLEDLDLDHDLEELNDELKEEVNGVTSFDNSRSDKVDTEFPQDDAKERIQSNSPKPRARPGSKVFGAKPREPTWRKRLSNQDRKIISISSESLVSTLAMEICESKSRGLWNKVSSTVTSGTFRALLPYESDDVFEPFDSIGLEDEEPKTRPRSRRLNRNRKTFQDIAVDTMERKAQKDHMLSELLCFEEKFTEDLEKLVMVVDEMKKSKNDSNHQVTMPDTLRTGRDNIVACNLRKMYDLYKNTILVGIKQSLFNPEEMRNIFLEQRVKLKDLYVRYCRRHGMIQHIVRSNEKYFGSLQKLLGLKEDFKNLLNVPVLHLTRYHLFFDGLAKLSLDEQETKIYKELYQIAKDISRNVNNVLALTRITRIPPDVNVFKQGDILHRGSLGCRVQLPKRSSSIRMRSSLKMKSLSMSKKADEKLVEVFLFDTSIIICHNKGKTQLFGSNEEYKFLVRMCIDTLEVDKSDSCNLEFVLKTEEDSKMILVAKNNKEKELWLQEIKKKLRIKNTESPSEISSDSTV